MQLANISSTKHLDSVGLMHEKSFWNLKMTQTSLQRRNRYEEKNWFALSFPIFLEYLLDIFLANIAAWAGRRNFAATPDFQPEPEADTSTKAQRNHPRSIIICQDEMKTLLKIDDEKTIGKVGAQI